MGVREIARFLKQWQMDGRDLHRRLILAAPGLGIQLMNLPGYSPDFNADEAVWGWAREEATGNLCLGTKALVRERVNNFLGSLASRRDEVKRRCRTALQSRAAGLLRDSQPNSPLDFVVSHRGMKITLAANFAKRNQFRAIS